jgi:hypothetical protein
MSFVCRKGSTEFQPVYCGTSSTLVRGELAFYDVSTGAAVSPVIDGTASLLAENVAGVVANTPASGDTYCNIIPIKGQLWEYDCTADTAAAQLGKINNLTNSATVDNSTTIVTAGTGIVKNIVLVGAVGDRKMQGYILGSNNAIAAS